MGELFLGEAFCSDVEALNTPKSTHGIAFVAEQAGSILLIHPLYVSSCRA